MSHLGSVNEMKGKILARKHGPGYFIFRAAMVSVAYVTFLFRGLSSVQFFNAASTVLFSVYVSRKNRQLIPAARDSFFVLRAAVATKELS